MIQPQAEQETGRWTAEGHSLTIEYPSLVMEGIRAAVVEGFYRIARGGIEVGGVLYGTRRRNSVHILAFRPLECEHASGPSFVLSEKDQEDLRGLLQAPAVESDLDGLIPVGWYHSHTRSGIFLSEEDCQIYDRFFPEPWQVALVLRPEKLKPVRAGFFFREAGGSLQATSSHREFVLEPAGRKKAVPDASTVPAAEVEPLPTLTAARPFRPRRLWVDWIIFTVAILSLFAAAALLAGPYVQSYLPKEWKLGPLFRPQPQADPKVNELTRQLERLRLEIKQLADSNQELEAEVEALQGRLNALEQQGGKPNRKKPR